MRKNPPRQRPLNAGANQRAVLALIRRLAGQANVLTIPRVFIELVGDVKGALLLSQSIYWSDRSSSGDGWFYKSYPEWQAELGLSEYEIATWAGTSKRPGKLSLWIETRLGQANGVPTVHYRVRMDKVLESVAEVLRRSEPAETPASDSREIPESETSVAQDPDSGESSESEGGDVQDPDSEETPESDYRETRGSGAENLWNGRGGQGRETGESSTETSEPSGQRINMDYEHARERVRSGTALPEEIWLLALKSLRMQMPRATYDVWVKNTRGLTYEGGTFVVGTASGYAKDWLEHRLHGTIRRTLAAVVGRDVEVRYVVGFRGKGGA